MLHSENTQEMEFYFKLVSLNLNQCLSLIKQLFSIFVSFSAESAIIIKIQVEDDSYFDSFGHSPKKSLMSKVENTRKLYVGYSA